MQLEDRKLTVGASAKVTADIIAREVVVYGNVKGNLRARDRIEIKKDGSVVGDLTTARIMIEDGAYFKGSIEIDKTGEASDSSHEKIFGVVFEVVSKHRDRVDFGFVELVVRERHRERARWRFAAHWQSSGLILLLGSTSVSDLCLKPAIDFVDKEIAP